MEVTLGPTRPAFGTAEPNEQLQRFEKCLYGYALKGKYGFKDMWGGYLNPSKGGVAKVNQILGYIVGQYHAGKMEFANALAEDFDNNMKYLATYAGEEEIEQYGSTLQIPNYQVHIGDDGTFMGLSLGWARRVTPEVEHDYNLQIERYTKDGPSVRFNYAYSHPGGMLYHGPQAGQVFAVVIGGPRLWSVHT
jgi:hypothetical protein